ncbi:hypothetical protein M758_9G146000 [Ceratodon purpureus]|nr:hypothetical protein M758_9G146000 [Ceratodon purpureus]
MKASISMVISVSFFVRNAWRHYLAASYTDWGSPSRMAGSIEKAPQALKIFLPSVPFACMVRTASLALSRDVRRSS